MTDSDALGQDLDAFLSAHAPAELARVIGAVAAASVPVAGLIARGQLGGETAGPVGALTDIDIQRGIDLFADKAFVAGLASAPARALLTEDRESPEPLNAQGAFLVALHPLDGAANADVAGAMGTLFSVLDAPAGRVPENQDFLVPGHRHRAAGMVVHGPHTDFVFTAGAGTHVATLDPESRAFRVTRLDIHIPERKTDLAINASNARFWPGPVRSYIEDCLMGEGGPRGKEFSMRWNGTLAADGYRVLRRGGAYLFPDDARAGNAQGRHRLLFEANPLALLVEQAGGMAIDGVNRILDITPKSANARTPLIFGSTDKVERIRSYFIDGHRSASRAPLFGKRGLLRG